MPDYTCRYPDGDVPMDAGSASAREVTVTFDPEDAVAILRALRGSCCPAALRTVAGAIAMDHGGR